MKSKRIRFVLICLAITNLISILIIINLHNTKENFIAYEFFGRNDNWEIDDINTVLYSNKYYMGNGTISYIGEEEEVAKNITEFHYSATMYVNDSPIPMFSYSSVHNDGTLDLLSNAERIGLGKSSIDGSLKKLYDETAKIKAEMHITYKSNGKKYEEAVPLQAQLLISNEK